MKHPYYDDGFPSAAWFFGLLPIVAIAVAAYLSSPTTSQRARIQLCSNFCGSETVSAQVEMCVCENGDTGTYKRNDDGYWVVIQTSKTAQRTDNETK
jgi:hypothetical protein